MVDFESAQPGEDHPEARAMIVHNLKFIGWAMHQFTNRDAGGSRLFATRKDGEPLLSWRVAILPWLEEFALYERFRLDETLDSPHNASLLREMPREYAPVAGKETTPYATYYQGLIGPRRCSMSRKARRSQRSLTPRTQPSWSSRQPVPSPGPSPGTCLIATQGRCRNSGASSRTAPMSVSPMAGTVPQQEDRSRNAPRPHHATATAGFLILTSSVHCEMTRSATLV